MVDMRNRMVKPATAVSLIAFALFMGLALGIRQGSFQTLDLQTYHSLHDTANEHPTLRQFFAGMKELSGLVAMIGVVLLVFGVLVYYGRYWLALAWGCAVEGASVANSVLLKNFFQRERPPHGRPRNATDWSFPSGHTLRAVVMYGFLAYLIVHYLPRRWARIIGVAAMVLVVVLIGLSRVFLGKHYPSDVLGGFIFGAGWLAAWIALVEVMNWRRNPQPRADTEPAPATVATPQVRSVRLSE
jgi:undecaprenyl-diphosphatase